MKENIIAVKTLFWVTLCILILMLGNYVTDGITGGLLLCTQILIPSVFPFMILANLAVKSGIADYIGKYTGKLTSWIFGISGKCSAVILLGLIGGYPVGANGIATLYKENKISRYEALKLSYSLVCAGPGFLITYIGLCTLESRTIGVCLIISQVLSVLIIGFINKFIFRKETDNSDKTQSKSVILSEALIYSVKDSTYSILEMCGTVTLFSAILSVFELLLSNNLNIVKYIAILLEVTTASNYLCSDNNIMLLAFSVGFAGLSIHFQIFHILRNIHLNKMVFLLYRTTQGCITTFLTYIIFRIFNISLPVYSSIASPDFSLSTTVIGSIMLIITGICFLNTTRNLHESNR